MTISQNPNSKRTPNLRRTARALKSGFRRYPRVILDSITESQTSHNPIYLPQILHDLAHHHLAILWLGHGSVVAQIGDVTVAVDPVLSQRIGMKIKSKTIGVPRLIPAPVSPESLIGSDIVLITHAHFDHLDKPTLKAMCSKTTTVIVPHRCAKLIPDGFKSIVELKANASLKLNGLTISAIEPKHWGARSIFDRRRGVNSYLVESNTQSVLFTGDTAETKAYKHLNAIDLAVFGIGAYDPWDHMHATPEQVWKMFQTLDARFMLPVHHSTFELSDEPTQEPMQRLLQIAKENTNAILVPTVGEILVIDPVTHSSQPDIKACQSDAPPLPKP